MNETNTEQRPERFESAVTLSREDLEALSLPLVIYSLRKRPPRHPRDSQRLKQFCVEKTAIDFRKYIEVFGQGGLPRGNDRGKYLITTPNGWRTIHRPPS